MSPELVAVVEELSLPAGDRVLEIGCGTGTDAVWLARQGFETIGVDVAPKAIEMARMRVEDCLVSNLWFETINILAIPPVEPGICGFVFDRGCFHSVGIEERSTFVQRVAEALRPNGYWLALCGNVDERRKSGVHGPPQLSAGDIVAAVERDFMILSLTRSQCSNADATLHLSWSCLMRRRDR